MEIWKDIPNYGNNYQASNLGRIKVKERIIEKFSVFANAIVLQKYKERLLNPSISTNLGHLTVHLGNKKQKWNVGVHRLVLEAFVGQCPDGMECCHNNGIANDNRLENLRWDTHENNNKDRKLHGKYPKGKDHPMYGKPISQELKDKLIAYHTGRKASQETKNKMKQSQLKRWEIIRVSQQKTT